MRCAAVVAVLVSLFVIAPVKAADNSPPRYKLEPGQVLNYSVNLTTDEESALRADASWKCYVVDKNDDAYTLVALYSFAYYRGDETTPAYKTSEATSIILHSDGRFEPDVSAIRADLRELFVPLPSDQKALSDTYTVHYADDCDVQAKLVSSTETDRTFDVSQTSPSDKVYLTTKSGKATFDAKRQLITSHEINLASEWPNKQTATTKITLTSVKYADQAVVRRMKQEFQRQREASAAYEGAIRKLYLGDNAIKQAADALDGLKKAAGEIETADLKAPVIGAIKNHADTVRYQLDTAKREHAILDRPAPAWNLTRISDGKKVSLADLKGKVVVLDFWYRGCGWCIRAMPQINTLAKDYAARGVVVLGMNTDRNVEDAKFVIDKMNLAYDSVRTLDDLPKRCGVQGFPTLVVIDQEGVVRHFHEGYSPTLRKDLGEVLDRLLNKPAAKAEQANSQ